MYVNYPLWNRTPRLDFGFAELEEARQEALDRPQDVDPSVVSGKSDEFDLCVTPGS